MLKGCQAASSALRKCDGNIDVPGPRRPVGSPNAAWPHFPKLPFGSCRIELGQPIPLIRDEADFPKSLYTHRARAKGQHLPLYLS